MRLCNWPILAGCFTLGVVGSSHKLFYVNSLGADRVIDKSAHILWQEAIKSSPKGLILSSMQMGQRH